MDEIVAGDSESDVSSGVRSCGRGHGEGSLRQTGSEAQIVVSATAGMDNSEKPSVVCNDSAVFETRATFIDTTSRLIPLGYERLRHSSVSFSIFIEFAKKTKIKNVLSTLNLQFAVN